jgi:hypothetical protein
LQQHTRVTLVAMCPLWLLVDWLLICSTSRDFVVCVCVCVLGWNLTAGPNLFVCLRIENDIFLISIFSIAMVNRTGSSSSLLSTPYLASSPKPGIFLLFLFSVIILSAILNVVFLFFYWRAVP